MHKSKEVDAPLEVVTYASVNQIAVGVIQPSLTTSRGFDVANLVAELVLNRFFHLKYPTSNEQQNTTKPSRVQSIDRKGLSLSRPFAKNFEFSSHTYITAKNNHD